MANRRQEEWQSLLADYRSSKESVGVFCKRHKMSMLPVIASEPKSGVDRAELVMPKGMILRFSVGTSARYVADIIKALA